MWKLMIVAFFLVAVEAQKKYDSWRRRGRYDYNWGHYGGGLGHEGGYGSSNGLYNGYDWKDVDYGLGGYSLGRRLLGSGFQRGYLGGRNIFGSQGGDLTGYKNVLGGYGLGKLGVDNGADNIYDGYSLESHGESGFGHDNHDYSIAKGSRLSGEYLSGGKYDPSSQRKGYTYTGGIGGLLWSRGSGAGALDADFVTGNYYPSKGHGSHGVFDSDLGGSGHGHGGHSSGLFDSDLGGSGLGHGGHSRGVFDSDLGGSGLGHGGHSHGVFDSDLSGFGLGHGGYGRGVFDSDLGGFGLGHGGHGRGVFDSDLGGSGLGHGGHSHKIYNHLPGKR